MRVTASSLALLYACAYSFRDDVEIPEQERSQASSRGTIFGLLAEEAINGGPPVNLSSLIADLSHEEAQRLIAMWGHAKTWLDEHKRIGWRAEQAFAWEPATDVGRELPRKKHRDYSEATPTELCGTADIVWIEGDSVVVADWKTTATGAPDVDARDQLEGLALMAARAWGYDSARIVTLVVTDQGVEPVEHEPLDVFSLAEVAERLRADLARIPNAEPQAGEHCTGRYCKAVSICPTTAMAMVQLVPDVALVRKEWRYQPVIESPDHLAHMLSIRPLIRKACEQVDATIEAYVADGPVFTSDGREIKKGFRTMPRMSQSALLDLVKQLGGTDEQIALCVRSVVEGNGVRISTASKKGRAA